MTKQEEFIRQAAARWYMRIRESSPDAPERSKFEAWLLADHRHQHAYRLVESTMEDFSSTERLKDLSAALTQQAYFERSTRNKKLSKLGTGLAALLLCVGLSFFAHMEYQQWQAAPVFAQTQTTAVAQIAKQTLSDGTVITANANTALEIVFYRNQRLIKLTRGEAVFEVAKDAKRPFVVATPYANVTVLGTRFAVNHLQDRTRISVDHGRVQITNNGENATPLILTNGGVAEVFRNSAPQKTNRNAADDFGFIDGLVIFDRANMLEVAETLSRYYQIPVKAQSFNHEDPKVNAVLKIEDTHTFISKLPQSVAVKVQRQNGEVIIQPAHPLVN